MIAIPTARIGSQFVPKVVKVVTEVKNGSGTHRVSLVQVTFIAGGKNQSLFYVDHVIAGRNAQRTYFLNRPEAKSGYRAMVESGFKYGIMQ